MPKPKPAIPAPAQGKEIPPTAIAAAILLALLAGLAISGNCAWDLVAHVEEFPQASDSFGYLQSAADIRAGHSPSGGEPFTADSAGARALIAHLKSAHIPAEKWESAVAPAAYHYVERSDKVVNQYPPGVGRLLALFPAGGALHTLYRVTFAAIAAAAVAVAVAAFIAVKRTESFAPLVGATATFLGLHAAINVLGTTASYSIDLFILPAIPAIALAALATRSGGRFRWLPPALALGAGMAAGYAVYSRVASALLLPGLAALLLTGPGNAAPTSARVPGPGATEGRRRWRAGRMIALAAWCVGVVLAGLLPLLLHQWRLTGSMLGSTYARADTAAPAFSAIASNLSHYVVGDGSLLNWPLYPALAATLVGFVAARLSAIGLSARFLLGPALLLTVPTAYFLTHPITTPYYQFPTIEATVLALGAVALAWPAMPLRAPWTTLLLGGVVLATGVHLAAALIAPRPIFGPPLPPRTLALPDAVKDSHALVIAARYSGTLWATHGVYAMDLAKAGPDTRRVIWQFLAARHDVVFLFDDRTAGEIKAGAHPLVREAVAAGASTGNIGSFEDAPVWRLAWPDTPH